MTQKQIISLATNEDAMYFLLRIAEIQRNLSSKTVYEQRAAKAKIKEFAKEIIDRLS